MISYHLLQFLTQFPFVFIVAYYIFLSEIDSREKNEKYILKIQQDA